MLFVGRAMPTEAGGEAVKLPSSQQVSIPGLPAHPVGVLRVGLPCAVSQNLAVRCFSRPSASQRREAGRWSMVVVKAHLPLASRCPESASAPRPSRCCLGHPLGWAPGDAVCYSSPHAATVSAWHPDVLRQLPRTSPDRVGMSRPQLQPSSRDPSSKSRCFACSLTGTQRVGEPPGALGGRAWGWAGQERGGWA